MKLIRLKRGDGFNWEYRKDIKRGDKVKVLDVPSLSISGRSYIGRTGKVISLQQGKYYVKFDYKEEASFYPKEIGKV